jgi:hypothetical protein
VLVDSKKKGFYIISWASLTCREFNNNFKFNAWGGGLAATYLSQIQIGLDYLWWNAL